VLDSPPSGPFRLHRLPGLTSWTVGNEDARDFVAGASSPAALPDPRGPFHGPLVAVCMKHCGSRECPREGYGPKGIHHDHCLSDGRGGGRPIRARSVGGSSAPLEATRGRESGWPQRPERAPVTTRISGLSCGRESSSVCYRNTPSLKKVINYLISIFRRLSSGRGSFLGIISSRTPLFIDPSALSGSTSSGKSILLLKPE